MQKISKILRRRKEKKYFSTIELIVSMSIIVILGGVFLLNYNLKKETFDLNNAVNISVQQVRKAQNLIMAQTTRSTTCTARPGEPAQNYSVYFTTVEGKNNYATLYVDKDEPEPDPCSIEDKYFSPSIKISKIFLDSSTESVDSAWVNFYKDTFSVKIKDNTIGKWQKIKIELCIKSDCTLQNTKKIIINNKGMVDVE